MRPKKVLISAAAILLAAGAGFAYWQFADKPTEAPFVTVPVQRGNIATSKG